MTINMPLGDLIDKSPKGEARFAHEEWLRTYVKRLTKGNKTKLKQALNEVDEAINQWRNGFFISTYDEKLSAVRQGKQNMDSQELEDVYNEETYLQKEGKTGLVADFLYDSIAQYGFINEHHRAAIEKRLAVSRHGVFATAMGILRSGSNKVVAGSHCFHAGNSTNDT